MGTPPTRIRDPTCTRGPETEREEEYVWHSELRTRTGTRGDTGREVICWTIRRADVQ